MQRGEIYSVDFGVPIGSVQGGKRPALVLQVDKGLVVQNDKGNKYSRTTIVAGITTRKKQPYGFRVEISAKESGLFEDGVVMLDQIATVNQQHLTKRIGQLNPSKMKEVDKALMISLGLIDE